MARVTEAVATEPSAIPLDAAFDDIRKDKPLPFLDTITPIDELEVIHNCMVRAQNTYKEAERLKRNASCVLSQDEVAAIRKYCSEDSSPPFYKALNAACREDPHRTKVIPYRHFMWLLLHALCRLEPYHGLEVYRGVKANLREQFQQIKATREVVTFWAFTSCTKTSEVLTERADFLGQTGPRTLFVMQLTQLQARDVSDYSPLSEGEILLPPGCAFEVRSVMPLDEELTLVTLAEVASGYLILDLNRTGDASPRPKDGPGTCTWPNGQSYCGEWHGGLRHGQGKLTNIGGTAGENYDGQFVGDKFHGIGTITLPSGQSYCGEFQDGKRHGQGKQTNCGGIAGFCCDGQFVGGKYHGTGTMTWPCGQSYCGEFQDGKLHGQGKLTNCGGTTGENYDGQFVGNKKHGRGTMTWPSGQSYCGEFQDGKRHGQGKQTNFCGIAGFCCDGQFVGDKFHGRGTGTWPNGQSYCGEFQDGKRHGQGKQTNCGGTAGENYDGQFVGGKYHGTGTHTSADGTVTSGQWKYGELVK